MANKQDLAKYRPVADVKAVFRFISANAGLAVFTVYLTIAVIGFIYLIAFYRRFDLNVVEYLEISDILVAGIKDPIVLLATLGALGVTVIAWAWTYVQAPFNAWLDKKFDKGLFRIIPLSLGVTTTRSFWWNALFIFIAYAALFIILHTKTKAEGIIDEKQGLVIVASDAITQPSDEYSLLGTSINFVFLYNHQKENCLIIPIENIQSIQPVKTQDGDEKEAEEKPEKKTEQAAAKSATNKEQ